ncbi:type I-F CRISPR-associated endoribonuclease Cas6/Csy4 [Burkholderia glumae]|uniref:type I-F CRISPR-associated endoribonuclease Cas6/Csy4 n=1 Tax=Burkholderia glumae TaxID=337 RepID=UPI0003A1F1DE|nr:type I-F CRISPR-associated endoribonuclease Cas6/Csy4 [Burkholderia glumae]MCM2496235.1 type I-F CRISPR-associated endoribonuclease Cas6/Csy4 [Burkholderia glumae]MCM2546510.1 type I-F CRISPR-associated endoribonuclease Cas6/Csy4 [Burkholderia glumae]
MTTHFIDIRLLPDPEFTQTHLFGALMSKLHRALVQTRRDDIGISFPGYSLRPRSIGTVLRLHGSDAGLRELMAQSWLQGMRDHVAVTEAAPVPAEAMHRSVRRRQFKTNAERLRRRRMLRKGETAEQAAAHIPDSVERRPELPYVQLRSASTGQGFCLFVELGQAGREAVAGSFNSYGLSQGATVPWF